MRPAAVAIGIVLSLAFFGATLGTASAASPFVVNKTGDAADLNPGNGKCDASSSSGLQCTLRAAIQEANATAGLDSITFNITATSKVISPSSQLPKITNPVTINGYSQTGASANTRSVGENAVIKIVLNGANAGSSANGLIVDNGGPTVIKGLVIQGFGAAGIEVLGRRATISGNFIGTTANGSNAVANHTGVSITGDTNTVGGSSVGARNIISGNGADGIDVSGDDATSNSILQNYIGTTKSGVAALPNGGDGIDVSGGFALIGGSGDGNVISGNQGFGIHVDTPTVGTKIRANRIGTDAAGSGALGNGGSGIFCADTSDLVIGTGTAATRNVIAANGLDGLLIIRCSDSTIAGNYIGTDSTGSVDLGNTGAGVNVIDGTGVTIGGSTSGTGNVISGNTTGVVLQGPSEIVQGNRIGTSATGSSDLGNDQHGIAILAGASNTIGGTGAAGNTVLFNDIGILADTGSNTITGNAVETNDREGIWLEGDSNTVGGNVVIGNGSTGVKVSAGGKGNRITANQMAANGGLGIDLGSAGVTANDSGDGDTGDNNQQNFPALSSAVRMSSGLTIVSGSFNSLPSTQFKIEFFIVSADASGHGEGFIFLGSTTITTNSSGNKSISLATAQLSPGQQVTATATNTSTGDTSEFSANVTVVAAP